MKEVFCKTKNKDSVFLIGTTVLTNIRANGKTVKNTEMGSGKILMEIIMLGNGSMEKLMVSGFIPRRMVKGTKATSLTF
jgi:hypothetical protein